MLRQEPAERHGCAGLHHGSGESNWIVLSIEKQIIVWRWLVVTIFLSEEQEKNGTVEIQNDEGGIDTAVIYSGERGASASIPAPVVLLSRITLRPSLSRNTGAKKDYRWRCACIRTWWKFIRIKGSCCRLWSEGLQMLHDSFIEQFRPKVCQTCRLCTEEDENEHCNDQ
jgi:hypothetical protein